MILLLTLQTFSYLNVAAKGLINFTNSGHNQKLHNNLRRREINYFDLVIHHTFGRSWKKTSGSRNLSWLNCDHLFTTFSQ